MAKITESELTALRRDLKRVSDLFYLKELASSGVVVVRYEGKENIEREVSPWLSVEGMQGYIRGWLDCGEAKRS